MPGAVAIIPARLGSTRFPRKVLAADTGKPMVVHVCERAAAASTVSRVVVATDSQEVEAAVRAHGFETVITSADHPNGTSRLAEAAERLQLERTTTIVNVQGDEPEIAEQVIDGAIAASRHKQHDTSATAHVGTVASPFDPREDPGNPNIVKAVVGLTDPDSNIGPALYFSRANIPFDRSGGSASHATPPLKHIGIYAYTTEALRKYVTLPPTPLEQTEMLEQLRWLEHGLTIAVAVRTTTHHGIDTPEQYAAFVERHRAAAAG